MQPHSQGSGVPVRESSPDLTFWLSEGPALKMPLESVSPVQRDAQQHVLKKASLLLRGGWGKQISDGTPGLLSA